MFLDVEDGALNVKIVLVARAPGVAAAELRRHAEVLPANARAELCEPTQGNIRLVGLDWFLPSRALDTGEIAHPHLYAIGCSPEAPVTEYEWFSLFHGADAVTRLGPTFPELEMLLETGELRDRVYPIDPRGIDEAVDRIVTWALREAATLE
jgi:hypothetical protein